MSAANLTTINSIKETSTLVRARFGPGMLLQHEDLEQLNTYTRDLSRLLFRSFFGCGVVCGLGVEIEEICGKLVVRVRSGLALDCAGDPIHVPKDQTLELNEDGEPVLVHSAFVILCRNSKCCSPRPPVCASDDDESPSVCTRERDGFEIRIVTELPPTKCICGCPEGYVLTDPESPCKCVDPTLDCYKAHYDGECGCNAGVGCDCHGECVLLAQLVSGIAGWLVDHSVRRFIRPVLMRDPKVPSGGPVAQPLEQSPTTATAPTAPAETTEPMAKASRKAKQQPEP